MNNLERYKDDLEQLIKTGERLHLAMRYQFQEERFINAIGEQLKEKAAKFFESLPNFSEEYQSWYSEAKALVRQLLPDRLNNFVGHYEKAKSRKDLTYESYRISDCLLPLEVTLGPQKQKIVGPDAAIPHFSQQLAIVKAIRNREVDPEIRTAL